MPYLGNNPTANFASVTKDTFSGNASTTAFTLSKPATTNGVAVYVENVRQIPTTAYSVSGTTLTFTGAPPSGTNNIYVMHHNTPVSTATHPSAQALTATSGTFSAGVSGTTGTFTGDVSIGDDLTLGSDSAVLNFGADNDVTLTHEADAGLLMNTTLRDTRASFGVYNNDNGNVSFGSADTITTITFNTTDFDVGSNVKSGNNSIFVAPVAGTYQVTARILVQGLNSSTYYNVTMYLATRPSGSSTISYPFSINRRANFYTAAQYLQLTGLVSVGAGADIFVRASFPNVSNLVYYASQSACNFFVHYVGNRNSGGT